MNCIVGAYYYYKTEPKKNYEQTMMDLVNKTVFTFKYVHVCFNRLYLFPSKKTKTPSPEKKNYHSNNKNYQ